MTHQPSPLHLTSDLMSTFFYDLITRSVYNITFGSKFLHASCIWFPPVVTPYLQETIFTGPQKNSLNLIDLSSINKVSLVKVSFCSNTGSIRDDPYWTSRKNSSELTNSNLLFIVVFKVGGLCVTMFSKDAATVMTFTPYFEGSAPLRLDNDSSFEICYRQV